MVMSQKKVNALDEHEAKDLLRQHGVDVVDEVLVRSQEEALRAGKAIGYPLVLKGCSREILHKTDAGLVTVGLQDEDQLKQTLRRMTDRVPGLEAFLVQQMVPGRREFLVGMTRDPIFGPCVAFGLGGVFTEAFKDVTYRVAPFPEAEAAIMCQEISSRKLLGPFRGEAPVNTQALARLLKAIGDFASARPDVTEIDLNPVMPLGDRVVAVDAVIVLS